MTVRGLLASHGLVTRGGLVRTFANAAKKPADRFAEFIASGEGKRPADKDEIPDHSSAYGDDPVATVADVRGEESQHKSKRAKKTKNGSKKSLD